MKRIFLLAMVFISLTLANAQQGLHFNPNFTPDYSIMNVAQYPSSQIQVQVLFSGTMDSVTILDSYGKPFGIAPAKENHDFIGISPEGDDYWISVNHERTDRNPLTGDGGGMTTFKVKRTPSGFFEVVESELPDGRKGKFHNVDFVNTVGATWTNCGGIIAPNGRIWTAEEYPFTKAQGNKSAMFLNDTADVIIGKGKMVPFINDAKQLFEGETLKAFENQGWMVEIDPKTSKAIRKQYNWGRMSFEAGAIMPDNKTVYLTEDLRPGMFTKFVAETAGDFTKGKLYVYSEDVAGNWIEMNNDDLNEMTNMSDYAFAKGASMYIRLEWVTEIDGKVYIAETGYDNVCKDKNWIKRHNQGGKYAAHHVARANAQGALLDTTGVGGKPYADYYGRVLVFDPSTNKMDVFLEGGPEYAQRQSQTIADYPENHLSNPDGLGKITINGKKYMIINEDLNGHDYNRLPLEAAGVNSCEMYMLDMSIANPTLNDLIRIAVGPKGAELTGGNGTQDGKTILVDIQHPSSSNPAPYNHATTMALVGWNSLTDVSAADFNVDWNNLNVFQSTPVAGINTQPLFSGTVDTVTIVDAYTKPAGFAPAKENHDFIGITPDGDDFWLSINHERTDRNPLTGDGGGMTTFKVKYNGNALEVVETELADGRKGYFHNVDFVNTVGATWTNCGGIIAPDGRIWTAEEYPFKKSEGNKAAMFLSDTADVIIGKGKMVPFINDAKQLFEGEKLKAYENQGWMVEIDPKSGKAIRKQYNWGRMSFEAGVVMPDNKTVYLTEDLRPGMFTKFVAETAGDFTTGKLYVYSEDVAGNWIEMNNNDLNEMTNMSDYAFAKGASMYIRLEWVIQIDGKVYICETGYDNVCKDKNWIKRHNEGGKYAAHHVARAAAQGALLDTTGVVNGKPYADFYGRILMFDPATNQMSVFLEGGPEYAEKQSQEVSAYPAKHLSNPDGLGKITINGKNYMIINEDLNGWTYNRVPAEALTAGFNACEMYLLDMSISNPTVADLARIMVGPKGAELTGGNGTPDGNTILVDIQHPSSSNDAPYNHAVTVALHGWNNFAESVKTIDSENNTFVQGYDFPTKTVFLTQSFDVTVFNIQGQKVLERTNTDRINLFDAPAGVYVLTNTVGQSTKVLIK